MPPSFSRILTLLAMLAMIQSAGLAAAEESSNLRKIAASGTIAIGYHESTPPFTFVNSDGKVMGYSYDISLKITTAIQRALKLPKLEIKPVSFTTQNRFAIVQNGTANFSCGATTNTAERQQHSAFSNTIFVAGSRLLTHKDSGIRDFPDLVGKSVTTFARSTSEKILRKLNSEQDYRMNIVSTFDRGATPLSVLQAGQADAYMMDDVLLYATRHEAWRPDDWIVTGKPQSFEAYGCILPKDDPAFKQIVDQEITRLMKSGEAAEIYRKWLLSPIPPKGINLNLPLSEAMSELYKNPNDKPFD